MKNVYTNWIEKTNSQIGNIEIRQFSKKGKSGQHHTTESLFNVESNERFEVQCCHLMFHVTVLSQ